jgi:hypothetical protein
MAPSLSGRSSVEDIESTGERSTTGGRTRTGRTIAVSAAPTSSNTAGATLLLKGYGPLVAFMVFFALMAIMAPTVAVDGQAASAPAAGQQTTGAGEPGGAGTEVDGDGDGGTSEAGDGVEGPQVDGEAAESGEAAGTTGTDATNGEADGNGGGGDDGSQASADGAQACQDRDLQVPGDPYSPPCIAFDGANGGATHRGVTDDAVLISARMSDEPGFQDTLANLADADISDSPEDVRRTIDGLLDYFNERFEFYGRELRVEYYTGQGSATTELLGGGREEAQADALTVAEDIGAFAELNAGSEPFGDALAQQGVINFGVPFLSREWMTARRPYSWSLSTDCSIVAESAATYAARRLDHGDATADHAGPGLQGEPRRVANVVPENPWYQECLDAALEIAAAEGVEPDLNLSYQLDLNTMSNQAANLVAQLQSQNITTVICSCDPVLPVFLTARAQEQDYHPEWVVTGVGFTTQDVVGQLFNQEQWSRAFGISYDGQAQNQQASLGYNAYKQVRDDEPAFTVQNIYLNLYMLALGIQGAGPNLTPETFEQGMFDYPGGQGPAGTWAFGDGNYTPTEDFREVYWDPNATSPFNNEQGAYIQPDDERYTFQEFPSGPPRVP